MPNEYTANTNRDSNYYVCPFLAEMAMTPSASATTVALAQETVNISGIDQKFVHTLSEANTKKFLEAFHVSGGKQNPTNSSAQDIANDPSGNTLVVDLSNSAHFREVIEAEINAAVNSAATPVGVAVWLNSQLTQVLSAEIVKTLGVNINVSSSVTVDASGAALNLANGLTAADNIGKARCETIYLQIKQATLELYADASGEPLTNALPLAGGDTLVFVFDIAKPAQVDVTSRGEQVINSEGSLTTLNGSAGSGVADSDAAPVLSAATGSGPFNWDTLTLNFNGPVQRVSFELTMYGAGKIETLRAAPSPYLPPYAQA